MKVRLLEEQVQHLQAEVHGPQAGAFRPQPRPLLGGGGGGGDGGGGGGDGLLDNNGVNIHRKQAKAHYLFGPVNRAK
eukprot:4512598-Prymnesium_polylepis.1